MDREFEDISLDLLRSRDAEACRGMVLRHHPPIYRFLAHLTRSAASAEELTCEVFATAWHALPDFDGRSSLATWLHRIAYTTFIDAQRRSSRFAAHLGRYAAEREGPAGGPAPPDGLETDERASRLRNALGRLSISDRALVLMHYTQGLSYSEIAIVVGEPAGTVKWRMSVLLRTLREALAELNDGISTQLRVASTGR